MLDGWRVGKERHSVRSSLDFDFVKSEFNGVPYRNVLSTHLASGTKKGNSNAKDLCSSKAIKVIDTIA